MPLIKLLHDLMTERSVRRVFNRSPEAVIARYELSATQKQALYTMTPATILVGIADEFANYNFTPGEFPVSSENFLPEQAGSPEYPAPTPTAFRLRPRRVTYADLPANHKFELNLYGQSFSRDASCTVTEDTTGQTLVVEYGAVIGTFRCSQFRCIATAVAGTYTVKVVNNPGGGGLEQQIPVPGKLKIL